MKWKLRDDVFLTVGGVVMFKGGFMHPFAFRDLMGEELYQELLARPRVVSSYDLEEENCNRDG